MTVKPLYSIIEMGNILPDLWKSITCLETSSYQHDDTRIHRFIEKIYHSICYINQHTEVLYNEIDFSHKQTCSFYEDIIYIVTYCRIIQTTLFMNIDRFTGSIASFIYTNSKKQSYWKKEIEDSFRKYITMEIEKNKQEYNHLI